MRHRWYSTITLALPTLAIFAWAADPTFARDGQGGRGWYGNGGYGNGWYGNGGYGNGWYGNGWYGNGWYGNGYGSYGNGWYGNGYGWRGGRGNWGYPSYGWYQPYAYGYYDQPDYADYYSSNPPDQGYRSFYSGPEDQNAAHLSVVVPSNAQVFFDGEKTSQRGQLRRFVTPSLDQGQNYTYEIRAVWDENGNKVERTRKVHVRAGQQSSVDFMAMGGRRDMHGTDYNRTDTYDRDRNRYDRNDVDRDRVRDRNDMNRTDVDQNRNLNRDRTDMNRTDTERNRDLNRDRTDMNRTDTNRNRTEPAPVPEPKDQNKPPLF
jgi:uncharacterized protein (TIGR03000 family)